MIKELLAKLEKPQRDTLMLAFDNLKTCILEIDGLFLAVHLSSVPAKYLLKERAGLWAAGEILDCSSHSDTEETSEKTP